MMEEVPRPSTRTRPSVEEDPLTGLPNVFAFLLEVPELMEGTTGTVVVVDVKGLGEVNLAYGESKGDEVIRRVASHLKDITYRANPEGQVYRIGGDEFVAVIPSPPPRLNSHSAPEWLQRPVLHPFQLVDGISARVFKLNYPSDVKDVIEILDVAAHRLQPDSSYSPLRATKTLSRRIRETIDLLREALQLAYTDDISGLPNHRAAQHAIRRALRYQTPENQHLSLLLVDGDHLRVYNDTLGYQAGHEMIRKLGSILAGETLPGETVARWLSGDEFMIVLPGVRRAEAFRRAQKLCKSVAKATAHWVYPITISVGVASFPEDAGDEDELIRKAEEANSLAKRGGKNRACYPPS